MYVLWQTPTVPRRGIAPNAIACVSNPLHNFQVVFFENNFQEFGTFNAVWVEIIKLHIFINQGGSIFKKELIYKQRLCVLLFILVSLS